MTSGGKFRDRREAGRMLAARLERYPDRDNALVLALPRGGVPVGHELACRLHLPLDVLVVRKLGVPGRKELAMGAIALGGIRVLHTGLLRALGISSERVEEVVAEELPELIRRERLYRGRRPPLDVSGRHVILVDDGLATGATMQAAVAALAQKQPARIVVAVPVGSPSACQKLCGLADEVVCLAAPDDFSAVSCWYEDFSQNRDDEVRQLLEDSARRTSAEHRTVSTLQTTQRASHE